MKIVDWKHDTEQKLGKIHFGEVKVETVKNRHLFGVRVFLNGLDPKAVRVELYADGTNGGGPVRQEMKQGAQPAGAQNGYIYSADVPADRPANDYTARVIPRHDGVSIPLENSGIIWQK
jgi:starch phosphorylase